MALVAGAVGALGVAAPVAGAADACPNAQLRTGLAAHLPDCRAYEQVSPANSAGGLAGVDTVFAPMFGASGASGDRMVFGSSGGIGTTERGWYKTYNLAKRDTTGWQTWQAMTTTDMNVPLDLSLLPTAAFPAADMTRLAITVNRSLGPPNMLQNFAISVYRTAPYGQGPPTWLSQTTLPGPQPAGSSDYPFGGSPDLSTVYFTYAHPLTDQDGDTARTGTAGLYMYHDGVLSPAGVLPSGLVDPGGALPAGSANAGSTTTSLSQSGRNQVSHDGSHLFFVSPAAGAPPQLYVQQNGAPGRLVSKDAAGNAAADGIADLTDGVSGYWNPKGYAFATPDGSRVIFRSASALTGDAPATGTKTYRATVSDASITVEYLPHVDGTPLAVNGDASRILFVRGGSDGSHVDIALWDEHRAGGAPYTLASDVSTSQRPIFDSRLTDDGKTAVFASSGDVAPGIAGPGGTATQIYRWSIGDAAPSCISCRTDGGTPAPFGSHLSNGPQVTTDNLATPSGRFPDGFNQSTVATSRGVSADGRRVFFDTGDPLDPVRDTNGQRDVYMWENGHVSLLTSGKSKGPSFLIDNSASGNDVFFVTMDGLIPSDTNETYDVYDARVDGGFATPGAPSCSGDACQGSTFAAVAPSAIGSLAFAGDGNVKSAMPSTRRKAVVRVHLVPRRRHVVRAVRFRVSVKVPGKGRITVAGRSLRAVKRTATGARTYRIRVSLTAKGRRALRKRHTLKVRARVRYRPSSGHAVTRIVHVTLKQPRHRKGR